MIGAVLGLIVVSIVLSLFGFWIIGIPFAAVAIVLFALFLMRGSRRAAAGKP